MSYGRFAIDSNVYVYTSPTGITCVLDDEVAKNKGINPEVFQAEYTLDPGASELKMLGYLLYLKHFKEILVPDRTFDMLCLQFNSYDVPRIHT